MLIHAGERVKEISRWFYRCPDCLSVMAADGNPYARLACACGCESCEKMGKVQRARLVTETERCPCDDRCTCALGPSCNCRCGGENHGAGLVSVVEQQDAGAVPVISPPDPAAIERGRAWRAAVEAAEKGVRARFPGWARKNAGEYVSDKEFRDYLAGRDAMKRLRAIEGMRVRKTRETKMQAFLALHAGGAAVALGPQANLF